MNLFVKKLFLAAIFNSCLFLALFIGIQNSSKKSKVDFKFDGEMQPDVALEEVYKELYPFSEIVGNSNVLIMPSQHSAAISYKMIKNLDTIIKQF